MHELAMVLVFDIDDTPAVFAPTDRPAVDDHITFRADDCKGDDVLYTEINKIQPDIWKIWWRRTLIDSFS